MTSLPRYAIAAALMICCTVICNFAQTPTKSPRKNSVAGRVTIKGKPVSGVFVGLRISDYGSPYEPLYKAATDQEGRYTVTDVPAGTYQAFTIAPAYVSSSGTGRETVVLTEGETVEGIDFALVRGGVITGRVVDPDGRPAIDQQVNLIAADPAPNQRGVNVFSSVQTDDRGIYRMFGLSAGRYKVTSGKGENGFNRARPFFKQSFFTEDSDGTDASKAKVVEVTEGSETEGVDIILGRAVQTFAASGRIIDGENGQPIANTRIGMQQIVDEHSNHYLGVNTSSNSKGEFRIENLPPGKYSIFVSPGIDTELRSEGIAFEIVDQEVNGLVVKTAKGSATVSGNIVLDNTDDKAVFAKLSQLRIQAFIQAAGPRLGPGMPHVTSVNPDGSFSLSGLEPGSIYFSLGSWDRGQMKGFTIARVEREGVVEPRGLEIKKGDQITNVRLVVNYGNSTIRGVVKVDDGPPPAGAHVLLRITKDGDARSNMQTPVDSRGHFVIDALPNGLYSFEASIFIPGLVTKSQLTARQQVNVAEGVVTDVIISLTTPKP